MKSETKLKIVKFLYQGTVILPAANSSGGQQGLFPQLFNPANTSLAQFLNTVFKAAIVVGAMLAVLRLGYAGFVYLTTDIVSHKQTARSIISNAVLGLLLLLAVWLILNQINPQILNLNIFQGTASEPARPCTGSGC